jgi:rhomboid protease GluP
MYLHFGFIHLICNMYSLYNLGPALERFFGVPLFLALYILCGLAGNLLSYAAESRSGQNKISAGASGAIFGLLGSYLVFAIMPGYSGVSLYGILRVLAINAFYTFSNKSINAMAHVGGLIGGAALTFVLLMAF